MVCLFAAAVAVTEWPTAVELNHHKREAGLARLAALGIEVSHYATLMVEIMADSADPRANDVYAALDMPFATLMGQVAAGLEK
jgi:hypothetical protein